MVKEPMMKKTNHHEATEREKNIDNPIPDLRRWEKVRRSVIDNLKKMKQELNEKCQETDDAWRDSDLAEIDSFEVEQLRREGMTPEEVSAWQEYNHAPVDADSFDDPQERALIADYIGQKKKFDSEKLETIIDNLRSRYRKNLYLDGSLRIEDWAKTWMVDAENAREIIENKRNREEEKYSPFVKNLEQLLAIMRGLESKLGRFVYGEEARESPRNAKPETADLLFDKYQEIVDLADATKEEIKSMFRRDKTVSDEEADRFADAILEKAGKFLQKFSRKLIRSGKTDGQELLNELESVRTDLILTAGAWKAADKTGLKLGDIKGVALERRTNGQMVGSESFARTLGDIHEHEIRRVLPRVSLLNPEKIMDRYATHLPENDRGALRDILGMVMIYGRNYEDRPELQAELLDGFIGSLLSRNGRTSYYILKKNADTVKNGTGIMAFIRYDESGNGKTKRAASFNVDTNLKELSLGGALFLESLERESKDCEIMGVCDGFSPANVFYVEKGGYVVEKIDIARMEQNRFPDFHIRKSPVEYGLPASGKRGLTELSASAGSGALVKTVDPKNDLEMRELSKLVNGEGYVITRMVNAGKSFRLGLEKAKPARAGGEFRYREAA